jgi:hypothetical protein
MFASFIPSPQPLEAPNHKLGWLCCSNTSFWMSIWLVTKQRINFKRNVQETIATPIVGYCYGHATVATVQ